ncbi:MAG: twin-arginine translocase subunit TatC [Puniceicoccales bacterium]|jgi:sec-independent protein translocase protein TatC|nr:twin-arginine translocase subunit TatC [Puniceicoccales bacterium]
MFRFLTVALTRFSRSLRSRRAKAEKKEGVAADAQPEQTEKEQEMGFLEHIDELRSMLLRCIGAFTLSMVVAFCYAKEIFAFMRRPLQKVIESGASPMAPATPAVAPSGSDPLEIVNALASIIFYGTVPAGSASAAPATDAATAEMIATANGDMVVMKFMDVFSILLNIGFVGGIALSGPFVLYFGSRFIGPALTPSEKKCVIPFCASAMILFILGCIFSFCWLIPVSIGVMFHFVRMFGLKMPWLASDYYSFVTMMTLLVGFTFQFPLVVIVLQYLEIIKTSTLYRVWRQVFVGILVTSLVISPLADPVSLIVLTSVLFTLYLLAVAIGGMLVRAKQKKRIAEELEYERTYGRRPAAAAALTTSEENTESPYDENYDSENSDNSEYYGTDESGETSEYNDDDPARYNAGPDNDYDNENYDDENNDAYDDETTENNEEETSEETGDSGEETGDGDGGEDNNEEEENNGGDETDDRNSENSEEKPVENSVSDEEVVSAKKKKPRGDLELME